MTTSRLPARNAGFFTIGIALAVLAVCGSFAAGVASNRQGEDTVARTTRSAPGPEPTEGAARSAPERASMRPGKDRTPGTVS